MLFWRMGVEFKDKIILNYSREVEWQQGITTQIGFLVHSQNWCVNSVAINTQVFYCSCPWSFLERGEYEMLFNVDIVNLLLKKQ